MNQDVIQKIRLRGYWRINFQPLVNAEKFESLGDCRDAVENSCVKLRGWNYPHFSQQRRKDSDAGPEDTFYHGWVDWMGHIEFWNMYASSQFLHYLALREDWLEEDTIFPQITTIQPGSSLGIIGSVIYQITEIHEFLSRLVRSGVYEEGVRVSISLNNTKGRVLWVDGRGRMPLGETYRTNAERIELQNQYARSELIAAPHSLSLKAILHIFDRFGWHKPPLEAIKKDQAELLAGLI